MSRQLQFSAVDCTGLSERASELVRQSISSNTKRGYRSDLAHFVEWGGGLPATDVQVATYLAAYADTLSLATLKRRIAALSKLHREAYSTDPTSSAVVRAAMRGLRRLRGTQQVRAKPLIKDDLLRVLDAIGRSPRDLRDRALLLVGFAGAFRRSELVALDRSDLSWWQNGVVISIRRSKTDQFRKGRKVSIPLGRSRWCPVGALREWLGVLERQDGPLFTPVDRLGRPRRPRLSDGAVSLIVRDRLRAAGLPTTGYSSHSLRAGFVTSAAFNGTPIWKIRKITGHASDELVARYIRDLDVDQMSLAII